MVAASKEGGCGCIILMATLFPQPCVLFSFSNFSFFCRVIQKHDSDCDGPVAHDPPSTLNRSARRMPLLENYSWSFMRLEKLHFFPLLNLYFSSFHFCLYLYLPFFFFFFFFLSHRLLRNLFFFQSSTQ